MPPRLQIRRGTASEWTAKNTLLLEGEIGLELDTSRLKIGDGATKWATLPYFFSSAPSIAVGGIYMNTTGIDPATELGFGSWEQIAAGRVLVGVNPADPDFATPELTGGEKTHVLTTTEVP